MKKMMTLLVALALGAGMTFAQDKCCKQECAGGDCAVKRTEKIALICKLDDAQKAEVLALTQNRMAQCGKDASRKEMKAEKKAYDKSLKKVIGKKNFRILKGCDKVVCKAVALNEKIAEKPAKPAKEKKSKK